MNEGMIDFDVAIDKLYSFDRGYEIAEFLQSQGVKGVPGKENSCAIAVWVTDVTGIEVLVTGCDIHAVDYRQDLLRWNTEAITEFIEEFDTGEYPELVNKYYGD